MYFQLGSLIWEKWIWQTKRNVLLPVRSTKYQFRFIVHTSSSNNFALCERAGARVSVCGAMQQTTHTQYNSQPSTLWYTHPHIWLMISIVCILWVSVCVLLCCVCDEWQKSTCSIKCFVEKYYIQWRWRWNDTIRRCLCVCVCLSWTRVYNFISIMYHWPLSSD